MIKLVIFDIGGVLVDFMETQYIEYLHENVLPEVDDRDLERFIMPLIELMEYGMLTVPELEHMVAKHFKANDLDLHWVKGWKKIAKPKNDVIDLLNAVSEKYRTALLSNVSRSRFAELRAGYLKLINVDKMYTSYQLRMRKPGPMIYEYVLKEEDVKPKEAVFVDNQIENVLGAEKVGIKAVWFRDYQRLLYDLEKFKITPL
ncbi:MAG: HAD family phosphatase [Candidatus Micrarchaeales archaeon]|nr:HAD family phosphatase [Candidatus Micrarchaeales archaeon]